VYLYKYKNIGGEREVNGYCWHYYATTTKKGMRIVPAQTARGRCKSSPRHNTPVIPYYVRPVFWTTLRVRQVPEKSCAKTGLTRRRKGFPPEFRYDVQGSRVVSRFPTDQRCSFRVIIIDKLSNRKWQRKKRLAEFISIIRLVDNTVCKDYRCVFSWFITRIPSGIQSDRDY